MVRRRKLSRAADFRWHRHRPTQTPPVTLGSLSPVSWVQLLLWSSVFDGWFNIRLNVTKRKWSINVTRVAGCCSLKCDSKVRWLRPPWRQSWVVQKVQRDCNLAPAWYITAVTRAQWSQLNTMCQNCCLCISTKLARPCALTQRFCYSDSPSEVCRLNPRGLWKKWPENQKLNVNEVMAAVKKWWVSPLLFKMQSIRPFYLYCTHLAWPPQQPRCKCFLWCGLLYSLVNRR